MLLFSVLIPERALNDIITMTSVRRLEIASKREADSLSRFQMAKDINDQVHMLKMFFIATSRFAVGFTVCNVISFSAEIVLDHKSVANAP